MRHKDYAEIPAQPTHAVLLRDNSTGDGDLFWLLAFLAPNNYYVNDGDDKEVFYSFETGKRLLDYVGDELVKVFELKSKE